MAKTNDRPLHKDVEDLVEASVTQESVNKVSQHLDQALEKLSAQNLEVISSFFSGTTIPELATRHAITESEMQNWLSQIKRELHQELRKSVKVKQ